MFPKFKNKAALMLATVLIMSINSFSQANKPATDYLTVPVPVSFDQKVFNLNWSSHPSANFYKQEYIPKGESANEYKTMLLLDVMTGGATVKAVVENKIAELKQMKLANPLVKYSVINNPATGEYLLDFVLTANAPNGTVNIAERNVYRYKSFADKAGQKGIVLFGVSTRAYGAGVAAFFASLKSNQNDFVKKVTAFKVPEITIR